MRVMPDGTVLARSLAGCCQLRSDKRTFPGATRVADNSSMEMRKTKTVLVVDDNPVHRYAMTRLLSHAGFKVAEAWNATEAIEAATRADAVAVDIFMPHGDGWRVCRSLRANSSTKSMPVLFYSSLYGEEARAECELAGGDGYYPLPVPPEFVSRIASLLGIR